MNNSHYSNIRETLPVSFVPPSPPSEASLTSAAPPHPPSEATLSSAPLQKRTLEEKEAALKLQSFARGYLSRKQTKATKWVNNQKINPQDLLFKIVKKETPVPSNISLHLVLDSLIEKGAVVNAKNDGDWTPLHSAVFHDNVPLIHFLIKHGADVNVKRNDGWSPLHSAVFHNYVPMAHLLITFNYLDKNDSMDFFTSDIENVTTEQIKDYYNTNKDQIDSLMKHRLLYALFQLKIILNGFL